MNDGDTNTAGSDGKGKSHGAEQARAKFEAQKLTRRQALAKVGLRFGATALLAVSVDDLARMVGRKLEQYAGDSQIAAAVAREFKNAGVALASDPSGCECPPEAQQDQSSFALHWGDYNCPAGTFTPAIPGTHRCGVCEFQNCTLIAGTCSQPGACPPTSPRQWCALGPNCPGGQYTIYFS